jgi:hypothetical protein
MDPVTFEPVGPPAPEAPVDAAPVLVAPVQLMVACTGCGHERTSMALHPQALAEALRCERCGEPNRVLAHRAMSGPGCSCCFG